MADRGFKKSSDGATGPLPQLEFWGFTAIHGIGSVGPWEVVHIRGRGTPKTKMVFLGVTHAYGGDHGTATVFCALALRGRRS